MMIQEKIRLGKTLTLPPNWQKTLRAADGDELVVLYHENGVLILKDLGDLHEFLQAFLEAPSFSRDDEYMARVAEMAAEYETCALVQLAAEYDGPGEQPMPPELEALYLEAMQETFQSHLPPLCEGTIVELPPEFVEQCLADR
jgi:hypothetical protein